MYMKLDRDTSLPFESISGHGCSRLLFCQNVGMVGQESLVTFIGVYYCTYYCFRV